MYKRPTSSRTPRRAIAKRQLLEGCDRREGVFVDGHCDHQSPTYLLPWRRQAEAPLAASIFFDLPDSTLPDRSWTELAWETEEPGMFSPLRLLAEPVKEALFTAPVPVLPRGEYERGLIELDGRCVDCEEEINPWEEGWLQGVFPHAQRVA